MLRPDVASAVYTVLIEECGAHPGDKAAFVWAFRDQHQEPSEWRFQGHLGFGGKYRHPKMVVDCYPEDCTPERQAMIDKANARLEVIRRDHDDARLQA